MQKDDWMDAARFALVICVVMVVVWLMGCAPTALRAAGFTVEEGV